MVDEDAATHLHFGDVISLSAPGEDDLLDPDMSDEESDVEDITVKPTDNLLLLGHVEGEAASLDVYGTLFSLAANFCQVHFFTISVLACSLQRRGRCLLRPPRHSAAIVSFGD